MSTRTTAAVSVKRGFYPDSAMKLIFALFLSGLACVTAVPSYCSEGELEKCSHYDPRTEDEAFKETEEYLNFMCKSMGCMRDFKRRCGTAGVGAYFKQMVNQAEVIYGAMCEEDSQPMRQKYLENAKCINRENIRMNDKCKMIKVDQNDASFCQKVEEFLDCTRDVVGKECGKDAREVQIAVSPGLEFYGCK